LLWKQSFEIKEEETIEKKEERMTNFQNYLLLARKHGKKSLRRSSRVSQELFIDLWRVAARTRQLHDNPDKTLSEELKKNQMDLMQRLDQNTDQNKNDKIEAKKKGVTQLTLKQSSTEDLEMTSEKVPPIVLVHLKKKKYVSKFACEICIRTKKSGTINRSRIVAGSVKDSRIFVDLIGEAAIYARIRSRIRKIIKKLIEAANDAIDKESNGVEQSSMNPDDLEQGESIVEEPEDPIEENTHQDDVEDASLLETEGNIRLDSITGLNNMIDKLFGFQMQWSRPKKIVNGVEIPIQRHTYTPSPANKMDQRPS
jgi:hypothetical protein